ncbi:MAG: PIN domain-containing protein [Acidimicrobiia bacterium]|nr:PIN domain-containing protein [Acidimicrobiia bacterium]
MTRGTARGPVVVDTGVFAAELTRSGAALAERYRPLLEGRNVFISFMTEAEVRFGAQQAGWGDARLRRLHQRLDVVEVVWPGPQLVEEYAKLRAWCVANGHGLGQKEHEADRWVAATAR